MARASKPAPWVPGVPNPGFEAWLAMMDAIVEDDFLTFDMDGRPEDPYTEEGLRVAEAAALRRFPDKTALQLPENVEMVDKFVRFVGQVYVVALGATWTDEPEFDDDPPTVAFRIPGQYGPVEPLRLLTIAVNRRTGEEWAFMFHNNKEAIEEERSRDTSAT